MENFKKWKGVVIIALAIIIPMLISFYFNVRGYNEVWKSYDLHFYIVIVSAIGSLLVGYLAFKEYKNTINFKTYLICIGFVGAGILYAFHALVKPGMTLGNLTFSAEQDNSFILFSDFSRVWIAIFLFLQCIVEEKYNVKVSKKLLIALVSFGIIVISMFIIAEPNILPNTRNDDYTYTVYALVTNVITLVFLGISFTRYYDSYKIVKNSAIFSLMLFCLFNMEAIIIYMVSKGWDGRWWMAHVIYMLSFFTVSMGFFIGKKRVEKFEFFNTQSQVEQYIIKLNLNQKQLEEANSKLESLAIMDPLTGLYNRHYINYYLTPKFRMEEERRHNIGIMFMDLDGFKNVNDSYGHEVGDKLLKQVAKLFRENVGEEDIVMRIGGDEFVIIFMNIIGRISLEAYADKIMTLLKAPIEVEENSCKIGVSIGMSQYPNDGTDIDILIRRADAAMYYIKENGKNGYVFYSDISYEEQVKNFIQ